MKENIILDKQEQLSLSQYFTKVYALMGAGLLTTGFVAYLFAETGLLIQLLTNYGMMPLYIIMGLELLFVWYLSRNIFELSKTTATLFFLTYAVLNGLTLSSIFLVYTMGSIASTFFITALTFGLMSLYGYITKADLSKIGNLLMMALIGVIIASIVNLFLASTTLYWIISIVGVFLFVGLTAYDTQKIKTNYFEAGYDTDLKDKLAITGALSLYLDFINLFLYLLRFLGNRD